MLRPREESSLVAVVEPSVINRGETALLSWDAANIKELHLEATGADVRKLDSAGEILISPKESAVFILRGTGKNGKIILKEVALRVIQPLPVIGARAEPTKIIRGQKSVLSWQSTDATKVEIDGVMYDLTGILEVSPTETTSYTLKAVGPGGEVSTTVEVVVVDPPLVYVVEKRFHSTAKLVQRKIEGKDGLFYDVVFPSLPKGALIRSPVDGTINGILIPVEWNQKTSIPALLIWDSKGTIVVIYDYGFQTEQVIGLADPARQVRAGATVMTVKEETVLHIWYWMTFDDYPGYPEYLQGLRNFLKKFFPLLEIPQEDKK
ncbi:MAG: hypothetical protein DDT42_01766 [candidate division WS2 bacterium]|uniref:Uncharacterized protein n=1 Tax=Psychracetigena formicireducens TaxID=2986056 RepID=A0A9E2F1W2_PSYF1|nr:hypothetical protein [Candidatus Psychracetigena formicireducens]